MVVFLWMPHQQTTVGQLSKKKQLQKNRLSMLEDGFLLYLI